MISGRVHLDVPESSLQNQHIPNRSHGSLLSSQAVSFALPILVSGSLPLACHASRKSSHRPLSPLPPCSVHLRIYKLILTLKSVLRLSLSPHFHLLRLSSHSPLTRIPQRILLVFLLLDHSVQRSSHQPHVAIVHLKCGYFKLRYKCQMHFINILLHAEMIIFSI